VKPLTMRLDDDIHAAMAALAQRHYRSLNGEILAALAAWIERHADELQKEKDG
jgi:predicted transcriptional regulator